MDKSKALRGLALILALSALLLLLIPLAALGSFAVPCADDYSYGAAAHLAYTRSGSIAGALAAGLEKTVLPARELSLELSKLFISLVTR